MTKENDSFKVAKIYSWSRKSKIRESNLNKNNNIYSKTKTKEENVRNKILTS